MKIKDAEAWKKWQDNNTDYYGGECVRYAEAWADLMEERMKCGVTVADVAERASRHADTNGITGFMYGAAVAMLASSWEHGEELRKWHNLDCQRGTEGERANESGGVLNPAILTIKEKAAE
uniref:Uncharacterized protein n=1 Tax=viral metagenome TaxID=1070528 RepID=A0A6M3JMF6_9ZZZZ